MDTDRNLLFGVLALQADLLDNARFAEACSAWAARKSVPLADLLVERGWLTAEDRRQVEQLLERKVKKHGGDARAGLAEAATPTALRSLAHVRDEEVRRSVDGLPNEEVASTTAHASASRGRYRLVNLHAQGGIGQVWLARDDELGRDVALKELRSERRDQAAARARFLEEARVTGQLEHPGIVPVHELVCSADGRSFYTMRLVRGRTLAEAIKEYHRKRRSGEAGPLDLRGLLTAFVSACQAVAYAHSRGVVHRDLKPTNVVLGDYGEVVVLDWGLAKVLGSAEEGAELSPVSLEASERDETAQGQVLGTPAYMAPEQAEGRVDQIGPATDVYGLGSVLYELLTGQPTFAGPTDEVIRRVAREEPARPRQVVAQSPVALEAVCLKALAKKPAERYASVGELEKEVERWLADEPVTAWREPLRKRAGRWARRHQTLVASAAAALLVVLLLGGGGLLLLAQGEARRRGAVEAELDRVESFQQAGRWPEALAALDLAEAHMGEAGPTDIRLRLRHTRAALELITQVEAIQFEGMSRWEVKIDHLKAIDAKYSEVLGAGGLVSIGEDEARVADRVSRSPGRELLVAALDHWANVASMTGDKKRAAWLLGVARKADPDPWRDRLRDASLWEGGAKLKSLVEQTPPSAFTPQLAKAIGLRLFGLIDEELFLRSVLLKQPNDYWLNQWLGLVLTNKGKKQEGIGYLRTAVALRKDSPVPTRLLAIEMMDLAKEREWRSETLPETEVIWREVISYLERDDRAEPNEHKGDLYHAYQNLGLALEMQGKAVESVAAYRRSLTFEPENQFVLGRLPHVEGMARVEAKLPAVLHGATRPDNNEDRLYLAILCQHRRLFRASTRLYAEVFAADAKMADDLEKGHRFGAACSAVMAASGEAGEGEKVEDEERARLRDQALRWLQADLAILQKRADKESAFSLDSYSEAPELTSVRPPALTNLPEGERQAWQKFWAEVRATADKLKAK